MASSVQYRLMINNSRLGYRVIAIEWTKDFYELFSSSEYWTSYSIREIDLYTCRFIDEAALIRYLASNNLLEKDDIINKPTGNFFIRVNSSDKNNYKHHSVLYMDNSELVTSPYNGLVSLMEEKLNIGDFDFFIFLSVQIKELCMFRGNKYNKSTNKLMALAEKLQATAIAAKNEESMRFELFHKTDKNGNNIIAETASLLVFGQNSGKEKSKSDASQFDNSLIHMVINWINMRNNLQGRSQPQRRALRQVPPTSVTPKKRSDASDHNSKLSGQMTFNDLY